MSCDEYRCPLFRVLPFVRELTWKKQNYSNE